jgi:hypothetical protein
MFLTFFNNSKFFKGKKVYIKETLEFDCRTLIHCRTLYDDRNYDRLFEVSNYLDSNRSRFF